MRRSFVRFVLWLFPLYHSRGTEFRTHRLWWLVIFGRDAQGEGYVMAALTRGRVLWLGEYGWFVYDSNTRSFPCGGED